MHPSPSCHRAAGYWSHLLVFQQVTTGFYCVFYDVLCSHQCLFLLDQGDHVRWFGVPPDALFMGPGRR